LNSIALLVFLLNTDDSWKTKAFYGQHSVSIKPSMQECSGLKIENTNVRQGSYQLRNNRDAYLSKILAEGIGHHISYFFSRQTYTDKKDKTELQLKITEIKVNQELIKEFKFEKMVIYSSNCS